MTCRVGHLVGEEDVRLVDWPGNAVPAGYARVIADVVGRGLMDNVQLNEPLLETKLASRGGGGGLPIVIPEGMRAYTIRVDEAIGVAGFIDQGTRVDVIVSMNPPNDSRNDLVTRIVLQNVEVLARGQNIQKDENGQPLVVPTVTLAVTPEDSGADGGDQHERALHAGAPQHDRREGSADFRHPDVGRADPAGRRAPAFVSFHGPRRGAADGGKPEGHRDVQGRQTRPDPFLRQGDTLGERVRISNDAAIPALRKRVPDRAGASVPGNGRTGGGAERPEPGGIDDPGQKGKMALMQFTFDLSKVAVGDPAIADAQIFAPADPRAA